MPLRCETSQRTSDGATGRSRNLPGTASGGRSNASTASPTRPQSPSGVCSVPLWLRNETSRMRRLRVVGVRRQVASLQRVHRMRAVDLGEVHVAERRLHVAEDRPLRVHLLALADDRDDVEVLEDERVAGDRARVDVQRRRAEVMRGPARHGIDRRAVRRGDVDPLMEREEAGALEPAREHAVQVHGARVAEEAADRVLLRERLDRPRVRRGAAREHERGRRKRQDDSEQMHRQCPPIMGRREDAAVSRSRGLCPALRTSVRRDRPGARCVQRCTGQ